jgi:hypothetical protein
MNRRILSKVDRPRKAIKAKPVEKQNGATRHARRITVAKNNAPPWKAVRVSIPSRKAPVIKKKKMVKGIVLAVRNVPMNKEIKGLHLAAVSKRRNELELLN